MALLEVARLRAGYGRVPVLGDVSFSIDEGEIAVLLGLNGAGKTTTVTNVVGLHRPWGGTVRFDGHDVTGRRPDELVAWGMCLVPEGRRVFPDLTVAENLRLGAWVHRRGDRRLVAETRAQVLELFPRLGERLDQAAGSMSGGEQQMLAIGRGLMCRPRLVLIDEASLGLSPLLARTVFEAVERIAAEGTTVVLVEQNVGALAHADRALVMEKGAVVYEGAGGELRDPANLRQRYLGA